MTPFAQEEHRIQHLALDRYNHANIQSTTFQRLTRRKHILTSYLKNLIRNDTKD